MMSRYRTAACYATFAFVLIFAAAVADHGEVEGQAAQIPPAPQTLAAGGQRVHVAPLTGLDHPWALAFLPNGDMLVTERPGRLRLVHDFVLDPKPIDGIPPVLSTQFQGLWDVALHPRFA